MIIRQFSCKVLTVLCQGIMDMRKISCAVIVAAAASASAVLATDESLGPAPGPTSGSTAAAPAVGLVAASLVSFFAYYLH